MKNSDNIIMRLAIFYLVFVFSLFADNIFIQKDFYQTSINWSESILTGTVDETIPDVEFDPDEPEYHKEGVAYNLTEARNIAMTKAKKRLNVLLFRGIENLTLDNDTLIRDNIALDEDFREKYNEIFQTSSISYTVKYKKNKVYVGGTFRLTGKDSLIYYLKKDYPAEPFPEFQSVHLAPEYTGLVVDARHLDINPALFPRILSDNGTEIYSYRFVDRSSALARGIVSYFQEPQQSLAKENLIGKKPFYVVALGSSGRYKTDLVIPAQEAMKLLSSGKTRNHLKRCKVIILLKQLP